MKEIVNFIKEGLKINSKTKINNIDIFKNIDVKDFEWQSAYSDDNYQKKCKEEVEKFADELYEDLKPFERIEQLFKDSYKQYLSTHKNWSQEKIDDQYDSQIKIIDKYRWAQFESNSLEQGWWAFMYWIKKKIKN